MERVVPGCIRFIRPRQTAAVSVTGGACQLDCAHCGGHYLQQMIPLSSLDADHLPPATSWLVSGGCGRDGSVALAEHLERLRELKGSKKFNVHVGLIKAEDVPGVAALADRVSFDFVGDDTTIREVFGIERRVEDYAECYQNLRRRVPVTPHICVGLHGGRLRGEGRALELLKEMGADSLTLIIFTPTPGTRYADCSPPPLNEVAEIFRQARRLFPDIPVQLGCMRPGGQYRDQVDRLALAAGLDAIVQPAPGARQLAQELQLTVTWGEECCGL
ncbi:MAG TPA: radical SAM protein [Patescibacteria group bacterium]|nr:radical SAM protein [Patescibacteria group bacterium]